MEPNPALLSSLLFIILIFIRIRYYSVRTPKLECQLKYTSKMSPTSEGPIGARGDEAILLDTVDESIALTISKDKDCHVKLKKPIAVKKGHVNELQLSLQTASVNDDLVVVKGKRSAAPFQPLPTCRSPG